jgi:glycosyltransferase involved in cell wall biosynthesis
MSQPIIWYLHHYAGAPSLGMSYRPYYLSQEFNKQGYKTWIVGASFHHLMHTPTLQTDPVCHKTIDEQDFLFLKTPVYKGNSPKRFLNMLTYAWSLWRHRKEILNITGAPSAIIVSSAHPFHYFFARRIAKQHNARLIFEVRDLWPLSLIELLNVSPSNPIVTLLNRIEKFAYRTADYVVSLLPYAFDYMSARGLSSDRFVHISNGITTLETQNTSQALSEHCQQLIANQKQQGRFLLGYAGAHGPPNSLDDLIQALLILKNEGYDKVHCFLVGDGCMKQSLQELVKNYDLNSVTFFDKLPKKAVGSFLQSMDAVYLGWKNKPLYRYGISPNKLFDYMSSAKPILHAFSGPHDLIKQNGLGLTVEAESPAAIAVGIKAMVALAPEDLKAMGNKGKNDVLSQFTYEQLGKKYIKLFEPCL